MARADEPNAFQNFADRGILKMHHSIAAEHASHWTLDGWGQAQTDGTRRFSDGTLVYCAS